TKLDGQMISSSAQLQERIYRLRPGDKVKLTYLRQSKEREVTVTLKEDTRSSASKEEKDIANNRSTTEMYNRIGAGYVPVTDVKKKELCVISGVVDTQVDRDRLYEYFNVQRRFLITHLHGQPVNSADKGATSLARCVRNIRQITGVPQRGSRVGLYLPPD